MTTSTLDQPTTFAPTQQVVEEARALLRHIDNNSATTIKVEISGQQSEEMSQELLNAMKAALAIISQGHKAEVVAVPQDLTTTVAAKRIGISRPTLMKLIREGQIPAHKVGSHFRIRTEDADTYRVKMLKEKTAKQKQAFQELRDLELSLGIID